MTKQRLRRTLATRCKRKIKTRRIVKKIIKEVARRRATGEPALEMPTHEQLQEAEQEILAYEAEDNRELSDRDKAIADCFIRLIFKFDWKRPFLSTQMRIEAYGHRRKPFSQRTKRQPATHP